MHMSNHREGWISDTNNLKFQRIKNSFLGQMLEQAHQGKINYYDFLLVAKKLAFRFEESAHLMDLKNFFAKNKNSVPAKRLADVLCVSQQSLQTQQDKIIVKFNVPDTQFATIKEETHEDEEGNDHDSGERDEHFEKMGSDIEQEHERQINQKIAIILSIKVDQMERKLKDINNLRDDHSIVRILQSLAAKEIDYDIFRKGLLAAIAPIREKIKISEEDIKTIFYILDSEHKGTIDLLQLEYLSDIESLRQNMKAFYKSRINRDMVKNTLFKLGKVKNNMIQIYQVKNASLLEFENIERSIVAEESFRMQKTSKPPHFGPLKGGMLASKDKTQTTPAYNSSKHMHRGTEIKFERERIEKILRHSKEEKRKDRKNETVASKLRSLFIHKVILPRQKMLEEEKERYMKHKGTENELYILAKR